MSEAPEAWLRGPIEGVDPYLMPVAHALAQAREDLEHVADGLSPADVWARPGGAASIGFHLRNLLRSIWPLRLPQGAVGSEKRVCRGTR